MKNKMKTIFGILAVVVVAATIVVLFLFQNKKAENIEEPEVDVSQVAELLLKDTEKNYPPTPKEVLKYYSEITCCFYNDDLTQEQLNKLADKSYELYDDELKANMPLEDYREDLQEDILEFKSQNIVVSGYSLSAAADVERYNRDGFEWSKLYATYRLRQGTEYLYTNEVFLLRKDDGGHWKIYGFALDSNETDEEMEEVAMNN